MRIAVHHNANLEHQRRLAHAFALGFKRHGQACEITAERTKEADIHVCMGPHYALEWWRKHPRCIWLDRAFWGDPEYVSVGWSTGEARTFPIGDEPRHKPELQDWRIGRNALVCADWQDTGESMRLLAAPHFHSVTVRRHPVEGGRGTLSDALRGKHVAIGKRTTALIEAAVLGVSVVCLDPNNPVLPVAGKSVRDIRKPDRREWLHQLSWGNWSVEEISNGELWNALTTRCG